MAAVKGPNGFLFVYGSLAPGQSNAHFLAPLKGTWRRAWARGFLHNAGWASGGGYPGLEVDPKGDRVMGQVFSSKDLDGFWPALDAFEAEEDYERVVTTIELSNGKFLKAYVYVVGVR